MAKKGREWWMVVWSLRLGSVIRVVKQFVGRKTHAAAESSHAPMKAMVRISTRTDFSSLIQKPREVRRAWRVWMAKRRV